MSHPINLQYIVDNRDDLLAELNRRLCIVRDFIRAVVYGRATGLYLHGAPGTGKTHVVRALLEAEQQVHAYKRGHITPLGLFELLRESADEIVVLDDMGTILSSRVALQILLVLQQHFADPPRRKSL